MQHRVTDIIDNFLNDSLPLRPVKLQNNLTIKKLNCIM